MHRKKDPKWSKHEKWKLCMMNMQVIFIFFVPCFLDIPSFSVAVLFTFVFQDPSQGCAGPCIWCSSGCAVICHLPVTVSSFLWRIIHSFKHRYNHWSWFLDLILNFSGAPGFYSPSIRSPKRTQIQRGWALTHSNSSEKVEWKEVERLRK